ncbi:MAG: DUF924 family protein [Hyphomicrobiaceae bacterium]
MSFWSDAGPSAWFKKSDTFDDAIRNSFSSEVVSARNGDLDAWLSEPVPALALILLLDQFPRNIFRNTLAMFESDAHALLSANKTIQSGHDRQLDEKLRAFVYMPFMHSENMADQERSLTLFDDLGIADNIKHAKAHADIIRRFGRFPHRNPILGRTSTAEEITFLNAGGFAG